MACLLTPRAIVDDPLMMSAHGGAFSLSIPRTLDVPRALRTSPFNVWRWVKWWRAGWPVAGAEYQSGLQRWRLKNTPLITGKANKLARRRREKRI